MPGGCHDRERERETSDSLSLSLQPPPAHASSRLGRMRHQYSFLYSAPSMRFLKKTFSKLVKEPVFSPPPPFLVSRLRYPPHTPLNTLPLVAPGEYTLTHTHTHISREKSLAATNPSALLTHAHTHTHTHTHTQTHTQHQKKNLAATNAYALPCATHTHTHTHTHTYTSTTNASAGAQWGRASRTYCHVQVGPTVIFFSAARQVSL